MTITLRGADERFSTRIDWLDSKHSFSFGHHYDPAEQGHGLLLVNNDDVVAPARGFGMHGHRDMEIVTWVLDGTLEHRDSEGNHGVLYPGLAQRMSAGTGIRHSEMNPSPDLPVHFVQMWVVPDTTGIRPGYQQLDINGELATGRLVPIASGQGHDAAISIRQRDAVLWGARLAAGASVEIPESPHVHLFVPRGAGALEQAGDLTEGAAARLVEAGPRRFTAADGGAEILVWATA